MAGYSLAVLAERQLQLLPLVWEDAGYTWAFVRQAWRIMRQKKKHRQAQMLEQGGEIPRLIDLRIMLLVLWRRGASWVTMFIAILSAIQIYAYIPTKHHPNPSPLIYPYSHIQIACSVLYLLCYLPWRIYRVAVSGQMNSSPLALAYEAYLQRLAKIAPSPPLS